MLALELPEPTKDEKQHSTKLVARIIQEIDQSAAYINFAEYMQLALYSPGLGYYAAGQQKFGEAGDFITAPELSPLFAQTLALSICQILAAMDRACVIEFGAGSGVLACGLLSELDRLGRLPEKYLIIELSAELKQRQQQQIKQQVPHLLERVQWLDSLPEQSMNAVVIANEVLDAMPVRRFIKQGDKICDLGVSHEAGQLHLITTEATEDLQQAVVAIESDLDRVFADSYQSEVNLNIGPWLRSIYDMLDTGVALLIDYGYPRSEYYLPERNMGTSMCYYRHRTHDNPLWYPGLQDITAFVDFSAVAQHAQAAGFELYGYTSQGNFLMDSGLPQIVDAQFSGDSRQQLQLVQQVKTLTLPTEMGERFKVMGLSKNWQSEIPGFGLRNYLSSL
ncbi:MAG: SAM-dependent methyltransferase [Gammaproteobacteria bacterium]|nr:SAM-dependent methyltransferase [Gammaproteobacteria bacterium]